MNGKKPITDNFLKDAFRFLLRWGLRLILLLVALSALIGALAFIANEYDAWKNESVILTALKCGPTNDNSEDYPKNRFISLRGNRQDKVIIKMQEIIPKSHVVEDIFNNWKKSYGFEYDAEKMTMTRDEYFYTETLEDGVKRKTSFNRKTLQRFFTESKDGVQINQTFRDCEEISVKEYNSELQSVEKAFSEGNKF